MTAMHSILRMVPPLLLGAALAICAKLGAGLLLFSGIGFLEALSVILATQMVAFGIGLWSVARVRDSGISESIRKRWLFILVAFAAAALFAGGWELLGGAAEPLTQGLGLALLAGLPLFAGGALLGLFGREPGALYKIGSPLTPPVLAALGAGAGFLLTGFVLIRTFPPTSILLGCVIALSGSALIHGRLLGERQRQRVMRIASLSDDPVAGTSLSGPSAEPDRGSDFPSPTPGQDV